MAVKGKIVRNILTSVLLILFAISSIPRTVFHDAMVHHQEIGKCTYPDKSVAHIHKQGFSCDVHELVVNLPYEQTLAPIVCIAIDLRVEHTTPALFNPIRTAYIHCSGRAPPLV